MEVNEKIEIEKKKLKEWTIKYFKQIKYGCYRNSCFNKYCLKSKSKF